MRVRAGAGSGVAAISGLILIAGFVVDARSTAAAYLVAWIAWGAIPIGALVLFMTSYLVRRRWTEALHPIFVAATGILPVVALTFIPVLLFMKEIYPAIADPASLPPFKARWFVPWFFVLRTVIYFSVWIGLAEWLRRAWRDDEAMVRAASVGSIAWILTVSFAGIDWMESLEPEFHSSIYGLIYLSFVLTNGAAFVIGGGLLSTRRIGPSRGYSGLLLSVVLLWCYLHAMQYIVIWSGNIPKEVTWYLVRSENGWQFILAALSFGQFVFPFCAMLSSSVRSDPHWLLALCGLTLAMRCVESSILILPAIHGRSFAMTAVMLLAAALFQGLVLWITFQAVLARVAEERAPIAGIWPQTRVEREARSAGQGQ
ncbi:MULTISPECIES: hypothetical protein [unclassified Bradyrhizobium]|uniref:hypothetical protein n=1 Tax=unclassified Bradyrhizobium TaxID=2631580 RepID=UPI00247AD3A2|nr:MULTISPECIES: hypothetical protein [unclassified Bradyrhizobium]WGR70534.1 hypothetical protein MTX24_35250 [Bradyrhizobium sp. ISRA426]WGR82589.1 hypothetical protein MTX21_20350 [Bradyrhizobium sp. ISRA430]WGR85775.1 hypothetical protein MTX25_34935 [Bradyrhizobium sp. ISRA432]